VLELADGPFVVMMWENGAHRVSRLCRCW
jgi:hypothetical protein